MQNKIKYLDQEQTWDSQVSVGYGLFPIGFVFAEYDLFKQYNFYTKLHIY